MADIISIVGARPQFIKAALVHKRLRENNIDDVLIHTGQHYDAGMSEIFFQELSLPKPDYFLGIGSGNHGAQTGKMLIEIEKVLLHERPRWVMVYGDTNTTLSGSIAASKLHISVAHIEAGLRSYNKSMPEEINRILSDHVSSLLLCPSMTAINNLRKENFSNIYNEGQLINFKDTIDIKRPGIYTSVADDSYSSPLVINVGDVMYDQILETLGRIDEAGVLEKYGLNERSYILATIHRPENTDAKDNLRSIIAALDHFAQNGIKVLFPVHPRTKKALDTFNISYKARSDMFQFHGPISYKEMVALEANATLTFTDSGGVQKESYFLKTPSIIPRNEVEWVELVESGWATLTGKTDIEIIETIEKKLKTQSPRPWSNVYGDGNAGQYISNLFKILLN